jgi:hypothetical protein
MKLAVVNVATGGYEAIAKPLLDSVVLYCPSATIFSVSRLSDIGSPSHQDDPYAFKLYAIKYMRDLGYDVVIWLDSPIRLVRPIDEWISKIESVGVYLQQDGWANGQWANDTALDWFKVSREEAMSISSVYACVMAFDFRVPITHEFFDLWWKSYEAGCFRGKWKNIDGCESSDPRCLGHRHDQTCAELTAHRLGIPLSPLVIGDFCRQW